MYFIIILNLKKYFGTTREILMSIINQSLIDLFKESVSKEATHQYEIRKYCTGRVLSTNEEMKHDWETAEKIVIKQLFQGNIPQYIFEPEIKVCSICFEEELSFVGCKFCHHQLCVKDAVRWLYNRNSCPYCRQQFY
jgi:hypothetical protein